MPRNQGQAIMLIFHGFPRRQTQKHAHRKAAHVRMGPGRGATQPPAWPRTRALLPPPGAAGG